MASNQIAIDEALQRETVDKEKVRNILSNVLLTDTLDYKATCSAIKSIASMKMAEFVDKMVACYKLPVEIKESLYSFPESGMMREIFESIDAGASVDNYNLVGLAYDTDTKEKFSFFIVSVSDSTLARRFRDGKLTVDDCKACFRYLALQKSFTEGHLISRKADYFDIDTGVVSSQLLTNMKIVVGEFARTIEKEEAKKLIDSELNFLTKEDIRQHKSYKEIQYGAIVKSLKDFRFDDRKIEELKNDARKKGYAYVEDYHCRPPSTLARFVTPASNKYFMATLALDSSFQFAKLIIFQLTPLPDSKIEKKEHLNCCRYLALKELNKEGFHGQNKIHDS